MDSVKKYARGGVALLVVALMVALCAACVALAPEKAYAYSLTQTSATKDSASITWEDPYKNSSSYTTLDYTVSWGKDYGSLTKSVKLDPTQTSYTFKGLKPGTKYYARVEYTYKSESSGTVYGPYTVCSGQIASRVVTPTGVKQSKWWYFVESVDFTWNRQDAADKVEYKVCKAGGSKVFYKDSRTYPSEKFSIPKVSNNMVYTVQMRVHDQWGWSAWSKKAYLFTQPMVVEKKTKVAGSKLTVTWGKISGATSYAVYVSTKEKSGYKKVATVKSSKSSVTVKKLGSKKISPKKTYYVYVVANKKVGGATYTSGRHYSYQVKGSSGSLRWTFD